MRCEARLLDGAGVAARPEQEDARAAVLRLGFDRNFSFQK